MHKVCGNVYLLKGNYQPNPDAELAKPGVMREIHIYKVCKTSNNEALATGFHKPNAKLIKITKSNPNGAYCVYLPKGLFSVFVNEPKGLYANIYDGQNYINPLNVVNGKNAIFDIEINHSATF